MEDLLVVRPVGVGGGPSFRLRMARAVAQDERGEVVFAGAAARRLEVVPYGPGSRLDAVEEVGVAVQRLTGGQLARGELAEKLDVRRVETARASLAPPPPGRQREARRRSPRASHGSCGACGQRRPDRPCRPARDSSRRRSCDRRGDVARAEADGLAGRPERRREPRDWQRGAPVRRLPDRRRERRWSRARRPATATDARARATLAQVRRACHSARREASATATAASTEVTRQSRESRRRPGASVAGGACRAGGLHLDPDTGPCAGSRLV